MAGFNFAPRGYAMCNGQVLSIAQNTALFSLLGTTYGGNGQTTFALPDLRSRAPIHVGQGSGLSSYDLGQRLGTESVTLGANEMPAHSHGLNATTAGGDQLTPTANLIAPDALGERRRLSKLERAAQTLHWLHRPSAKLEATSRTPTFSHISSSISTLLCKGFSQAAIS